MKNIFQFVDDVLFVKPKYKIEAGDEFSSFMLQRWISMANPVYCNFINSIYNTNYTGFEDDQMVYDYLKCLFPKKNVGRIPYIKKEASTNTDKNTKIIEDIAKALQISQREVREFFEMFPKDLKDYKDSDATARKKIAKDDNID